MKALHTLPLRLRRRATSVLVADLALLATVLVVLVACGATEPAAVAPASPGAPAAGASAPGTSPTGAVPRRKARRAGLGTVPPGFPILAGMPVVDSGEPPRVSPEGRGLRSLDLCGERPLRHLDLYDQRVAAAHGPERAVTRHLVVLTGIHDSYAVTDRVTAAARDCPSSESGPGSVTRTEVRRSDFGDAARILVRTYEQDGRTVPGAEIVQLIPVVGALLVTSSYAEWFPGPTLEAAIREDGESLRTTVAAMCVFTEVGCSGHEPPTIGPEGVGSVVLGMSPLEVEAAGGALEDPHGDPCVHFGFALPTGEAVRGMLAPRIGVSVLSVEHGRTPEGAGPGSTTAQLRRIHPNLTTDGGDRLADVPHTDRRYRFTMSGDTVASVALEYADQPC